MHYEPLLVFIDKGFKFQLYVCTCFYDVLMMCLNLNDVEYCWIINGISKSEAVFLLDLINEMDH